MSHIWSCLCPRAEGRGCEDVATSCGTLQFFGDAKGHLIMQCSWMNCPKIMHIYHEDDATMVLEGQKRLCPITCGYDMHI